jgi:hypothetical protein
MKVTIEIGGSHGPPTRREIDQHIDCLREIESGRPMTLYREGSLFAARMLWVAIRKNLFPDDEIPEDKAGFFGRCSLGRPEWRDLRGSLITEDDCRVRLYEPPAWVLKFPEPEDD